MNLPSPESALPASDAIRRFWLRYWLVWLALLPLIVVRQAGVTVLQLVTTVRTFNRRFAFLDGRLEILFVNNLRSALISTVFGERFGIARFEEAIVDPGPPFAARRVIAGFAPRRSCVSAVVVTHAHEEHVGNAAEVAESFAVPVYGSIASLQAIESPPRLSFVRRAMIGQPRPRPLRLRGDLDRLEVDAGLRPLPSDGHCGGHVSYYAADEGILFVGDSFMDEIFTSPNAEVDAQRWRETLRVYETLDIRTMIGTHGTVTTIDPRLPSRFGVVERDDPKARIARKLAFLDWATAVVRCGEQRGLPYSVIEASLFPWNRTWSWKNFCLDELARLLTRGEFSRTQFVRSLSAQPERVPPRFGWLGRRFGAR